MLELNRKFLPFFKRKARYKIAYGGRNGSKSHNIAILLLLKGKDKKLLIVCLREYQKNLEDSVYQLLCNKIRQDETLSKHYRIMSDRILGSNGTKFSFSGIKNAKNFKSFEGADIAWIEEAQSISAESMIISLPTIRKPGSELWFSYNPESEDDPVHKQMQSGFELSRDELNESGYDVGQINLLINYYDNPHCPPIMRMMAEQQKKADYELYQHIWEGQTRTASEAIIYKNKFFVEDFEVKDHSGIPRFHGQVVDFFYGLDFGWVHPCAMIESFRYEGNIYITNEVVGKEMDLDDITTRFINEFPYGRYKKIYADSARPDMIDGLKYARMSKEGAQLPGLNIEPANKGAGSVQSGITWLKTHTRIIIHPRCVHTIDNFKKYSYKKDKNGVITVDILKINDDCLDALRYSYTPLIGEDTLGIDWNDTDFQKEIHQDYATHDYEY